MPALVSLALALPALFQAEGPGLGNLTYTPAELFQPIAVLHHPNGYTSSTMVNGWFMTVAAGDNNPATKAIEFWDFSNPRAPQLAYQHATAETAKLREAHSFGLSADGYGTEVIAFQASRGVMFFDVSDPSAIQRLGYLQLPNLSSVYGSLFWLFWQPPYLYVPAADAGLYVCRVDDPAAPVVLRQLTTSQLGGIAPNQVFVVGSLMVLVRSKELGFGTFDVSDPENPVPLSLTNGARGYSHVFAAGKILTAGGDGGPVQMFVHDVGHDGSMSLVGSVGSGFSNGAYGSYQDGFFHVGMSNAYAKFDVDALLQVGSASTNIPNRDEDQCQVFGNLAFVGDDHGVGSGLYVHDLQPDSRGPDVAWVHPADGAADVPLTARVGVSLTDNVDFRTVGGSTFVVRELGGPPLPGKYGVQMGLANFAPDAPLLPGTVYEVSVNGVEDFVGNSGAAFTSRFTTGSGLPSGPAIQQVVAQGPKPYRTGTLQPGALIYVDRDYTYGAGMPARLQGQPYILTANDDKFGTGASFLTFQLAATSKVDVLFDRRATQLPAWLAAWTPTGESFSGYDVYERDHPAGLVSLGGNADPPMQGAQSMYGVVVLPEGVPPSIGTFTLAPAETGAPVAFSAPAGGGTPPLLYSWDFGDGSPPTPPAATTSASHVYSDAGRYAVTLHVTNAFGATAAAGLQVAYAPPTAVRPTAAATLIHTGARVVCVNEDAGTLTALDAASFARQWEVPAGSHPRTVARSPQGELWVAARDDDALVVLREADGALLRTIPLGHGAAPEGVAFAPDGKRVFVTLGGGAAPRPPRRSGALAVDANPARRLDLARVLALDPTTDAIVARAVLPAPTRGLAVAHDSRTVYVTRFTSAHPRTTGTIWELDAATLALRAPHSLAFDPGPDTERSGRGVPNYLSALVLSPDGATLLVPSKKDNTARGLWRSGQPLTFESRTRTIVSQVDLVAGAEDLARRLDLNDRDLAVAAAFTPNGDLFAVATLGSNVVDVFDAASNAQLATYAAGRGPRGLAFSPDGTRLFVHDTLDRAVKVFDTTDLASGTSAFAGELAEVATVATEPLGPTVLRGKRIFHDAADRRMNLDGYLSCASCHLDGDGDAQVWDFTQAGEGLRNTIALAGRGGLGHGRVHWTANFDEIQDFENDIRAGFAGVGFMLDADFEATANPLGAPKAGLSSALDALAAYVATLDTFPRSPYRTSVGAQTRSALHGQAVFQRLACASCHTPPTFTDGARHDVGTVLPSSGLGIGQPLAGVGFDTPTLRGVWSTPPYLHDGRAATLQEVFDAGGGHAGAETLSRGERADLEAYLLQLE